MRRVQKSLAIAQRIFLTFAHQINEHRGHIVLAVAISPCEGRVTVSRRIGLPRAEASITVAGDPGEIGVNIFQIVDDRQR